jgi:hypothetical protein
MVKNEDPDQYIHGMAAVNRSKSIALYDVPAKNQAA